MFDASISCNFLSFTCQRWRYAPVNAVIELESYREERSHAYEGEWLLHVS